MAKANYLLNLIQRTKYSPQKALFSSDISFTFAEIYQMAYALACQLEQYELKRGDKVVIQSNNQLILITLFYATQLLDLVYIPIDVHYPKDIVMDILDRTHAKIYIGSSLDQKKTIVHLSESEINYKRQEGILSISAERKADEMSVILYTSGSTGKPKGVMLSNNNLFKSAKIVFENYQWTTKDKILNLAPIHTVSGIRNSFIVPLLSESSFIYLDYSKQASFLEIIDIIYRLKATILLTSPVLIKQINLFKHKISSDKFQSLRYIMSTGNWLSVEMAKTFSKHFSVPIYNYYGLTETTGICIGQTPKHSTDIPQSIGFPLSCEIKIDTSVDDHFDRSQIGVLKIRGNNMLGYYKEQELTQKVIDKEGWFKTMDLAGLNPDGSVNLYGRYDDAFNNEYTELVFPQEIETIILEFSYISQCCVFDYTTLNGIIKIGAAITLKENLFDTHHILKSINQKIRDKLSPTKTLSRIWIVSSLPVGNYGKINRKKLKQELIDNGQSTPY